MEIIKKRPLFTASSIFFITGIAAYYLSGIVKAVAMSALAVLFAALIIAWGKGHRERLKTVIVIILPAFLAFGVSYIWFDVYTDSFRCYENEPRKIEAQVEEVVSGTDYSTLAIVRVHAVEGKKVNAKAELYLEYECDLSENDLITLTASFEQFEEYENGFPQKKYELSKGRLFRLVSKENDVSVSRPESLTLLQKIALLRRKASARFSVLLNGNDGGFASALLLGDRSGLEQTLIRDFRRFGISHMLAISGMHLAILSGAIEKLLVALRIKKGVRYILLSVFVLFFSALTGFSSSVLRASIMLLMYYLAYFLFAERDRLTSLAVSAALICLFNPSSVVDCGLQLSVMATLGLILADELKNGKDKKSKAEAYLVCAVAPVMTSLPLMWIYFGEVSLVSPITNLIFGIPITLVLYLLPVLLIFPQIGPLSTILSLLIDLIRKGAGLAAYFPGVLLSLRREFTPVALICAAFTAVFVLFIKRKGSGKLVLPLISFAVVFFSSLGVYRALHINDTSLACVNYSKSDMLVLSSSEELLICDMSDGSYTPAKLASGLSKTEFATDEIDVYMLTHYHKKHLSSVFEIANRYYLKILLLPEPQNEADKAISDMLVTSSCEMGIRTVFYPSDRENVIQFANAEITVTQREYLKRSSHPLVALSVTSGDTTLAYLGSSFAETVLSADFLEKSLDQSYIIILGAHGPITKTAIDTDRVSVPIIVTGSDPGQNADAGFFRVDGKNGKYFTKIRFQ